MSEQQQQEDLSQLKGPSRWWAVLLGFATTILAVLVWYIHARVGWFGHPAWWELALSLGVLVGWMVSFALWKGHNNSDRRLVWWWKDGEAWRVTAQGYPEKAKGLVVEVRVKARPRFTLRWGSKGWCHTLIDGWLANLKGERLQFVPSSQAALASEGLTVDVVDFLFNSSWRWCVIPLDAGRVLRFVDQRACAIEVRYTCLDGVDLEEILRSKDCADYHQRMQEKAREHNEAYSFMYDVLEALGLPKPVGKETLTERLAQVKRQGAQLRDERASAWAHLCHWLAVLRQDMDCAGRPKAKHAAALRVQAALQYLHAHLPSDSLFRSSDGISQKALEELAALIAVEEAKRAPKDAPRPEGVGTEV